MKKRQLLKSASKVQKTQKWEKSNSKWKQTLDCWGETWEQLSKVSKNKAWKDQKTANLEKSVELEKIMKKMKTMCWKKSTKLWKTSPEVYRSSQKWNQKMPKFTEDRKPFFYKNSEKERWKTQNSHRENELSTARSAKNSHETRKKTIFWRKEVQKG